MLALPLQRASSANTVPLLKSFLTSTFGTGADLKFDSDLTDFQRVRENAIAVTQSSGESGLIALSVIIHQLKSMAPRLAEYQNDLHLLFNYQDAFLPTKNIQCTSLYYELSTFLWNFAALHSQVGSRIDRSTDDGIRTANKHFQVAAGALDWITDNCIPNLHEEVNFGPVKPPVLRMMSMLMLAQAQLCFYEKALRDKKAGLMKPGIVAKLAAQTALNYKSTVDMSKMSGCASYIDLSWSNHVEFQYKCFLAAAEFSQSQAAKEAAQNKGTGYGEEIARLIRATALVSSAIDFANRNKLGVSLTNGAAGLQRSIEAAKCIAENDNRRVYMEVVPADSTLAQIVPVAMAKPSTAPESADGAVEKEFFREIQPKAFRALLTATRETLDQLLMQAADYAADATNEGRKQLSSVGLPASLETYKSGGEFPDNLWVSVQRVQSLGGASELTERHTDLEGAAQRAARSIEGIDASIAREERIDLAFRARFPSSTKTTPSTVLNGDIKMNVTRLKEAFDNARKSDLSLVAEMHDPSYVHTMHLLQLNKQELTQLLPKHVEPLIDLMGHDEGEGEGYHSANISILESKLFEMASTIEERDQSIATLKRIALMDLNDILSAIPFQSNQETRLSNLEAALQSHVLEAQGVAQTVTKSVSIQDDLLKAILTANEAFVRGRKTDPITVERDDMLRSVADGISKFFTVHSQLASGATFYSNLQTRLTALLQSSDDLSYTQHLARQDCEKEQHEEYERANQEKTDREYAENLNKQMSLLSAASLPKAAPSSSPAPRSSGVPSSSIAQPQPQPVSGSGPVSGSAPLYSTSNVVYGQVLGGPAPTPSVPQQTFSGYPAVYPQQPAPYPSLHTPPPSASPASSSASRYTPEQKQRMTGPLAQPLTQKAPAVDPKASRLIEMGFDPAKVVRALAANGGKEEEALQSLLSDS